MNKVLAVNAEDLTVTVQAGVTRTQVNDEIRHTGLFFPIDPAPTRRSAACARPAPAAPTRSATARCARNALGLTVVTAQGEVIHTGTRARKSSAGYDLTRLMIGSEGTLGVMTEITLRVYPLPEAMSAATCTFPSIDAAVRTTIQLIQMGIPIARCELLDRYAVQAVNRHDKLSLTEAPMLLMEFHGSSAGVAEQAAMVQEIASEHGGEGFQWATTPEERKKLWAARHRAYFAGLQMKPGCRTVTTDTCVPISRLAEAVVSASEEAEAAGMMHYIVGHVGDGNFHIAYLVDRPSRPSARPPSASTRRW
jgi:D-lactate dehydrogenase (cytochrome)